MKKTLIAAVTALTLMGIAPRAEAKLFEVWASGLAGGGYGTSTSNKDFFKHVNGVSVGAELGIKILFIGAYVGYERYLTGTGYGDFVSFNLGGDFTLSLTKRLDLVIRAGGGFYLATLPDTAKYYDEDLKRDEPMESTRGVGARAGAGLRFKFAKVFAIGITPTLGYHYFFGPSGTSMTDDNSHGFDVTALAYFRVGLGF